MIKVLTASALFSIIIISSSNSIILCTLSVINLSLPRRLNTVSLNLAGCAVDKVTFKSYFFSHLFADAIPTAVCGSTIIL